MTRQPLVIANWKMNLTSSEASKLVQEYCKSLKNQTETEVVICPSFVYLKDVKTLISTTSLLLGAQNCFWEAKGAFTGCVSPTMLLDCGVNYCLIGHSETRGRFGTSTLTDKQVNYFSETSHTLNLKIKALLEEYIHPVLCVGETLQEREDNLTFSIIESQILDALVQIDSTDLYDLVLAYEPVWAIGTGKTCEPTQAQEVCHFIRKVILKNFGPDLAYKIRILYGGSVKPDNATLLFSQEDIDGGLIGGASLNSKDFINIVNSTKN